MYMRKLKYLGALWFLTLQACAYLDGLGEDQKHLRYSKNPNVPVLEEKEYKRVTRKSLESDNHLDDSAGSLWKSEGQSPYLFSQNKVRRSGDLVNIKMEGAGLKQIEGKVQVLKDLMAKLEARQAASEAANLGSPTAPTPGYPNSTPNSGEVAKTGTGVEGSANTPVKPEEKSVNTQSNSEPLVSSVPARIVDQMNNGVYRVKGSQPFMIGQREYKVIVSGLIRGEDFNESGMSSNQLLEPQFDVVGLKKVIK